MANISVIKLVNIGKICSKYKMCINFGGYLLYIGMDIMNIVSQAIEFNRFNCRSTGQQLRLKQSNKGNKQSYSIYVDNIKAGNSKLIAEVGLYGHNVESIQCYFKGIYEVVADLGGQNIVGHGNKLYINANFEDYCILIEEIENEVSIRVGKTNREFKNSFSLNEGNTFGYDRNSVQDYSDKLNEMVNIQDRERIKIGNEKELEDNNKRYAEEQAKKQQIENERYRIKLQISNIEEIERIVKENIQEIDKKIEKVQGNYEGVQPRIKELIQKKYITVKENSIQINKDADKSYTEKKKVTRAESTPIVVCTDAGNNCLSRLTSFATPSYYVQEGTSYITNDEEVYHEDTEFLKVKYEVGKIKGIISEMNMLKENKRKLEDELVKMHKTKIRIGF